MAEMVRTMQASMRAGGGDDGGGVLHGGHGGHGGSEDGRWAASDEGGSVGRSAAAQAAAEYPWRRGDRSPMRA